MEGDFSLHLRAAYLTMHRRANARFARFGVTADQYVVLTALATGGGVTQQELVRRCYSDPNTLRAILLRLESEQLVERLPHETDRRARSVSLTPQGIRLQAELAAFNKSFQADLENLFSTAEVVALRAALLRVARAMDSSNPTEPAPHAPTLPISVAAAHLPPTS